MMKQKLKYSPKSYISISSSILSFALSILSFSNIHLTLWWHYAVAAILLLLSFCVFYVLMIGIDYLLFYKFAKANIVIDNQEYTLMLIDLCEKLHEAGIDYDASAVSHEWKMIREHQIIETYNKAKLIVENLKELNEGPVRIQSQTPYNGNLVNQIQTFLESIKAAYSFIPQ